MGQDIWRTEVKHLDLAPAVVLAICIILGLAGYVDYNPFIWTVLVLGFLASASQAIWPEWTGRLPKKALQPFLVMVIATISAVTMWLTVTDSITVVDKVLVATFVGGYYAYLWTERIKNSPRVVTVNVRRD